MISVADIPYTDAPAAVGIPPFRFHYAKANAAYGNAHRGEQVGSLMDSQPSPAAAVAPGVAESIGAAQRQGECAIGQIQPPPVFVHFRELTDPLYRGVVLIITPEGDAEVLFLIAEAG
ncbi:hypothetical protein D3C76_1568970 [compost metagenome]